MKTTLGFVRIWIMAVAVLLGTSAVCAAQQPSMGITPHQKDQLKKLAVETREKTDREREILKHARQDLFQVYLAYNLDEHKAKVAMEKISKSQMDLLNIHLDNQVALRGILGTEQFDRFTRIVSGRRGHGAAGISGMAEDIFPGNILSKQFLDDLGVDPDQQKRAFALMGQMRHRGKIMEKLRRNSMQMLDLYSQYSLDVHAAKKLIDSIHDGQADLSEMNHKKQQILRSILNESQFQQMVDRTAHAMHKRWRRE